jgi:cell division protein FtsB
VVWIIFFDQNNLIDRVSALAKFRQMEEDKLYFQEKIKTDTRKLQELRTDRENLEKFAREQYLMKKTDEDIFIVVND